MFDPQREARIAGLPEQASFDALDRRFEDPPFSERVQRERRTAPAHHPVTGLNVFVEFAR